MLTTQIEPYHVVQTSNPDVITEICRFRVSVWREEHQLAYGAFPAGEWRDECDDSALHWLLRDSRQRLAAAGRLTMHDSLAEVDQCHEYSRFELDLAGPVAAPDRVVVARFARGHGLGRQLLDLQDAAAHARGAAYAVRQASPRMAQLLANRGWEVLGPASADPRFPDVDFLATLKRF